jgi:hypothetical protein
LDTLKVTSTRYKNKSNFMKLNVGILEAKFQQKLKNRKSSSNTSNSQIEETVTLNIPQIGKIILVIDSIYSPEPIFSSNDDNFKKVLCHVKGYPPKVNTLILKNNGIGGRIDIPDHGEVDILNLGSGYHFIATPYRDTLQRGKY